MSSTFERLARKLVPGYGRRAALARFKRTNATACYGLMEADEFMADGASLDIVACYRREAMRSVRAARRYKKISEGRCAYN